ncbi:putative formin, FH2 domain superfamily [Helianthus annuus]|nr:putative formin, FH2 domain superfamily [Helianthus annuus]
MMDNEFFRNGKIQEVGIVQETIVDEVFVEMREENSEVELVSPGEFRSEVDNKNIIYQRKEPENQLVLNSGSVSVVIFDDENADVGWESEQLNQTKGVNESTYVCIVDEEKMSRITKHLHWTDTGWVYNRECSGGVIVQFKACFKYVDENMVWEVGDNVEVKGVDEEIVTGMLQKWHEWKSRWVWPKIGSKSCLKGKRRMRSYIGDKELSGKCEQFFLELMMVPPESKLQAFLFQIQFNTQLSLFKKSLKTVNIACDEVWNYVKFKEIKKFFLYLVGTLDRLVWWVREPIWYINPTSVAHTTDVGQVPYLAMVLVHNNILQRM